MNLFNKPITIGAILGLVIATGVAGVIETQFPVKASAQDITPPGTQPYTITLKDGTKDGLVIKDAPNALNQPLQVKDQYGAPIFEVHSVGGASVDGDSFKVFPPGDIFHPVIVLDPNGRISITGLNAGVWIDGQLLTSSDIAWIHSHE